MANITDIPHPDILPIYNKYFEAVHGIKNASKVPILNTSSLTQNDFINEWVAKNQPCLIKDAIRHWSAIGKWNDKNYWLIKCRNFQIKAFPYQNFNDKKIQDKERLALNYHSAIERLFSLRDEIFSIPGETISSTNNFAEILKDVGDFNFITNVPLPRWAPQFRFFSYRNAATGWHYHDMDETLLCQVVGTKRVVLFPPSMQRSKYITKFFLEERYLKGEQLDKSIHLKIQIVDVEEGDALYIPPYWHHLVVPTDNNVGFTLAYCWGSPLHIFGDFRNYYVRRLYKLSIMSLSARTFLAPFIAIGAGGSFLIKRIAGKI